MTAGSLLLNDTLDTLQRLGTHFWGLCKLATITLLTSAGLLLFYAW
jgi:hypothetical protein